MKNVKFALLLVVGMIFSFVVPVFAQTSIEEVQAKMKAARNAGVRTLAEVQEELKKADNQRQLAAIKGVIHNYGVLDNTEYTVLDVQVVSLPHKSTIGDVAVNLNNNGIRNLRKIMQANAISEERAKNLPADFELYVLNNMINEDFILDPHEVAMLKKQYEVDKAAAKLAVERLTSKVGELKEEIVIKDGIIVNLREELKIEKDAHVETKNTLVETKEELSIKTAEVQQVKGSYSSLQAWAIGISIGVIILFVVYSVIKSRMAERRQKKAQQNVDKMRREHEAGKGGFVAGRTTRRTVSTAKDKSRDSSLDSSLLAV